MNVINGVVTDVADGYAIITAVLRKLVILAKALVAQNRLWQT